MTKNIVIVALAVLLAVLGTLALVMGQQRATVEVRVWEDVNDPERNYISARAAGGSWRDLGTVPLDMSGISESGRYRYGDIELAVPVSGAPAEPTPTPMPTATSTPTPSPTVTPTTGPTGRVNDPTSTPTPEPTPTSTSAPTAQMCVNTPSICSGDKIWCGLDARAERMETCAEAHGVYLDAHALRGQYAPQHHERLDGHKRNAREWWESNSCGEQYGGVDIGAADTCPSDWQNPVHW